MAIEPSLRTKNLNSSIANFLHANETKPIDASRKIMSLPETPFKPENSQIISFLKEKEKKTKKFFL